MMSTGKKYSIPSLSEMEQDSNTIPKVTSHFALAQRRKLDSNISKKSEESAVDKTTPEPSAQISSGREQEDTKTSNDRIQNAPSTSRDSINPPPIKSSVSPVKPPVSSSSLLVNRRQKGNPLLRFIRNVPHTYSDIVPDYVMSPKNCALFLSLRYHQLNPSYVHERLKQLGHTYELRVLLVQVDIKDPHFLLKQLAKISILSDCTMILAWSPEEAGRYLETYKSFEDKPPNLIMERTENNFMAQMTDCLTSTRKVNKTDTITLANSFNNLEEIFHASTEDLSLCPGFGINKAKRLHGVIHEPFLKPKKTKT